MATVVYSNTKKIVKVDGEVYEKDLLEGLLQSEGLEKDDISHPKIGLTGFARFYKSRSVGLLYVIISEFDYEKSPHSTNLFVANGGNLTALENLMRKIRELYESMGFKSVGYGTFR